MIVFKNVNISQCNIINFQDVTNVQKQIFTREILPKINLKLKFVTWSNFGRFLNVEANEIIKITRIL
jgi:hypothetical protein